MRDEVFLVMCNIVNQDRNIAGQDSRVRNLELPMRFTVVINQREFNTRLHTVHAVAFTYRCKKAYVKKKHRNIN